MPILGFFRSKRFLAVWSTRPCWTSLRASGRLPDGLPSGTTVPDVSESLHRALGLTDDEAERIDSILGRPANGLELAMYSVM